MLPDFKSSVRAVEFALYKLDRHVQKCSQQIHPRKGYLNPCSRRFIIRGIAKSIGIRYRFPGAQIESFYTQFTHVLTAY